MRQFSWTALRFGLAVALVAGLVFYLLGRWDQAIRETESRWDQEVRAALHTRRSYQARQDSLSRLIERLSQRSARESERARRAEQSVAQVRPTLAADTSARDSVVTLLAVVAQLDSARAAWRDAYLAEAEARAAATARAALAETRVGELEALLEKRPRACRIAWVLPCPGRLTSFALGAAGTLVVVLAAK